MAQKTARNTSATDETAKGFTAAERAAMKERARELKAEARASKDREAGERDALAKIAELPTWGGSSLPRSTRAIPGACGRRWLTMPPFGLCRTATPFARQTRSWPISVR